MKKPNGKRLLELKSILCSKHLRWKEKREVRSDALIIFVRNKLKRTLLEHYEEAQREALAGIKVDSLLETFEMERKKRSEVQYEMKESELHSKAKTSIIRAKEFIFEMEK